MTQKKYDIVYSITAHESIECVYNLYENIIKSNPGIDCLVIFHLEDKLYEQRNTLPIHTNLIFNPIHTKKHRFTSTIFLAHIDNYLYVRNYDFDFFCFLDSNNLFIKPVDYKTIKKETPSLNITQTGYKYPSWDTWQQEEFFKNQKLVKIFQDHNIEICVSTHCGMYLRKEVINHIVDFCKTNGIDKKIFTYDHFAAEEIVLPSLVKYSTGFLPKRYCWQQYRYTPKDITDIINKSEWRGLKNLHHNIIKAKRDMNDPLRKYCENNINQHQVIAN